MVQQLHCRSGYWTVSLPSLTACWMRAKVVSLLGLLNILHSFCRDRPLSGSPLCYKAYQQIVPAFTRISRGC